MKPYGLIGDEWIVSYAAGAMSEGHALLVASHVTYHDDLQQKLRDAENIGGALLETSDAAAVSDEAFESVMARLGAPQAETEPVRSDVLPPPLADYLGCGLEDLNWRYMGPGMHQVRLWTGPEGERLWLLRAKGGIQIPAHDHQGLEMTLVLQGSYRVESKHYTPGLLELADDTLIGHQPQIDDGEDCICLVVTEAPIRLHSFVGRMVQPFIGL